MTLFLEWFCHIQYELYVSQFDHTHIMFILNLDTTDPRYEGCFQDNSTIPARAMYPKLSCDYSQTITRAINKCYASKNTYAGVEVNTFNRNFRVNCLFSNIKV